MSEDFVPTKNIAPVSKHNLLALALVVVFLVAVSYGAFQYWLPKWISPGDITNNNATQAVENVGLNDTSVSRAGVEGVLVLSGASWASAASEFKTYSLDLTGETPTLTNESERFNIFSSSFVEFENKQEPNDFFFRALRPATTSDGVPFLLNALYHAAFPDEVSELSDALAQQFGIMDYSPSAGSLAYASLRDTENVDGDISLVWNWDVLVADKDNELVQTIDGAANPVWSPDGQRLFYTKAEGLYAYDFEAEAEVSLLSINISEPNEAVRIGTMFGISPDGRYLILTAQGSGQIEVYEVLPEPLTLQFVGRIVDRGTAFSWPVVSPDGATYAVLARDIVSSKPENPRVEVRGILGREVVFSYPLSDFNPANVFIDDWIAKTVGN